MLLMDYRTHQRRLLPPLAKTYALSFAQDRLIAALHEAFTDPDTGDRARRELETLAAGVKAVASRHATDTIQACREACGGAGYLRANRFAALKADTDVFTTFEGDNTVLLQLAGKNLLTGYKDAFGELDPLGAAQFVAGQALGMLAERTGLLKLIPGRDDGGDLLERGTQLEAFADAVERSGEPVLDRLCTLYALHTIEAERGWYQEHGKLTGARSKAVIKIVNALCAELREDAGVLVDAFGVPDACLADAGDARPHARLVATLSLATDLEAAA
jgi:acyl-CoA oxidase